MPLEIPILLGLFAVFLAISHRRLHANRDVEWERRWRQLPLRERRRIARSAQRGERIEDPEKAALAAGSAREQLQIASGPANYAWGMLVIFSIMTLALLAEGSFLLAPVGLAGICFAVWRVRRETNRAALLARAEQVNRTGPRGPA
jgi:hypothetical protein